MRRTPTRRVLIDRDTDRRVRKFIAYGAGSRAERVKALRSAIYRAMLGDLIERIRERNRDIDPAVIEADIDAAVDEVRAEMK
jgi:hypothetical protein